MKAKSLKSHAKAKQNRQLKWRIFAFVLLHGLIGLHLYLWYVAEWRLIGAIDMQELFRHLIEHNALTAGAVFFLLAIALGLLWGRYFCGWLCHIGQTYDLLAALYTKLKIPMHNYALRWGPIVATGILLWYFLREAITNRLKRPPSGFVMDMGMTEPWELLPGWLAGSLTLGLILLVLPVIMGPRVFCRQLCPWGVLLGWTNRLSRLKVRRTGNCTMCGTCSTACPMDLDVSRLINTEFRVDRVGCTSCLQCVAACPTDALTLSLPSKENREPQKRKLLQPYTFVPVKEELVFWVLCIAMGWVYGGFYGQGIFFAFSMGLLSAWLTIWAYKKARKKSSAGMLVLALLILGWGVVVKDGFAHAHFDMGRKAFLKQDFTHAQKHYERSDALMWVAPNDLLYHLYIIYKSTGQEEKRKALYDRYEARRKAQKKLTKSN